MKYKRGRVAITTATQIVPVAEEYTVPRYAVPIHIGHVRSLLLGSLVCYEYGIPFHVRLDASLEGPNMLDCGIDITNCLNDLQIPFDLMYCVGRYDPNYSRIGDIVGKEKAERLQRILTPAGLDNHNQVTVLLDDLMNYAPSLIIRGMEFKRLDADYCGKSNVNGIAGAVRVEKLIAEVLEVERHELNLPLIMLGYMKMGKSVQSISWRALTMVEPDVAKRFLVATALCPGDPFSALGEKFTVAKMSEDPYVWSWADWSRVVRNGIAS